MCNRQDAPDRYTSLAMEIRCTEHMIKRRICQMESESVQQDLTGGQGVILGYIRHSKKTDVYQKDIEQKFNIRRSTATVALQKLEQAGLICRVAVKSDARLKKIELTPEGTAAAQRMENRIVCMDAEMAQGITEQEKQEFLRILHKINQNLDRSGDDPEPNKTERIAKAENEKVPR